MEDYTPKFKDIIESLFVKYAAPLTELLQSAMQGTANKLALLLLTADHDVQNALRLPIWLGADP
eukprot:8186567-Ditylum_brightwellii.AAC.1